MTEALRVPLHDEAPDHAPELRQRQASDPQSSAWVNASAGSGKTTVLTNRVTRLLLDGVSPARILCLTYTRAAAAEMAIRVTAKLSQWATCSDEELSASIGELQGRAPEKGQLIAARRLFAQVLSCPGGMRIRTIHAFCQEILRRFPIEADLPPHFTVMEEIDARALQEEVQAELLRDAGVEEDSTLGRALRALVDSLDESGFDEAMRGILSERARLTDAIRKAGSLDKLLTRQRTQLGLAPDENLDAIIHAASNDAALHRIELEKAAKAMAGAGKQCQDFSRTILSWLAVGVEGRLRDFDSYSDSFFTKGKLHASYADKKTLQACPEAEAILVREATRLQSVLERLEIARIAENTTAVLTFGAAFIQRYEVRKRAQAVLDYDDLIIRTYQLLSSSAMARWVMYKLDYGLAHILVDEAQDTSRAQWSIIQALADEFFAGSGAVADENRTLFVVGDEKQSIFSFQRADPEAFAAMRDYFEGRIRDAEKEFRQVPMRVSFRSAPAILQAVDGVFAQDSARAGVSPVTIIHNAAPEDRTKPEKVGRVELWNLQPAAKKTEDGENWEPPLSYEDEEDPQVKLAQQIARRIKEWRDAKTLLPGLGRPVEPGDIMILLRRRGRFADLMVRALKQQNIPVTGVDRMKLVKQLPVMDLLALVQFALLPEDDLNLASILRGPLLNFSEEQLMQLAIGRVGSLWQSLMVQQDKNPAFRAAHEYLAKQLDKADFATPFAFLARILNEPCLGSAISGRQAVWSRLGLDALDPVEELLNAAQNFSRRHAPSLQHFLHWLMATEAEIKRELEQGGGQVRIMTVHASKGLEAPIVFLPDSVSVPRSQDMPKFLWSADDVPYYITKTPASNLARPLWDAARQKQMEEYRRLMYVALTRAASQLYICGWEPVKKQADADQSWYSLSQQGLRGLNQESVQTEHEYLNIAFADQPLQKAVKPGTAASKSAEIIKLPKWAIEPAEFEMSTVRPIAPSLVLDPSATATPDRAFARGRIIHRLLESLPDIEDDKRDAIAAFFLANSQFELSAAQQKDIQKEVLDLLRNPTYAPLFGPQSRAEVPLAGKFDGEEITGQVDRLALLNEEIWIVDFKTNRPPPVEAKDAPLAYRRQLAAYRAILAEIYPQHTIRCFLLWTYAARLMELLPADLAA